MFWGCLFRDAKEREITHFVASGRVKQNKAGKYGVKESSSVASCAFVPLLKRVLLVVLRRENALKSKFPFLNGMVSTFMVPQNLL